jgi:hypothetical protein
MRLEGAIGLTPSTVDLVTIALAPVLRGCAVALPAMRTEPVVHPLMRREVLERQPFAAGGATLVGWLRDHSCERLSPRVLGQGLRGWPSGDMPPPSPTYFAALFTART